jgi:hypothetical protein
MLHAWAAAVSVTALSSESSVQWLTVEGDPASSTVDTVQVAPGTIAVFDNLRVMQIRVSWATLRNGHDGQKYQSYQATAEIHCRNKTAKWRRHEYYTVPLWKGSSRQFEHPEPNLPTMSFASMSPNPSSAHRSSRLHIARCENGLRRCRLDQPQLGFEQHIL